MSAGKLLARAGWACRNLVKVLVGWLVVVPVVSIVPRRRDWIAVIGKHGGKFIDNGKYFFIQGAPLLAPANRCVFVTDRRDTRDMLAGTNYEVLYYPTLRSAWFLARAGCVVFESAGWNAGLRGYLLVGAKKIQLWHGVGFKRLTKWGRWAGRKSGNSVSSRIRELLQGVARKLIGQSVTYHLFNTTSAFYKTNVFEPVFDANNFLVTGYPRNAFETFRKPLSDIVWKNVDPDIAARLGEWGSTDTRLVVVAPTLRTDKSLPLDLDSRLLDELDRFCAQENVVFLFKFHPLSPHSSQLRREHIHVIDPNSDLYPIMPHCRALVTDYSSIYMDYLLLDHPVHFYTPEQFEQGNGIGGFQFDLDTMMPGPKHGSWDELLVSLLEQWSTDDYSDDRARLRRLAFDDLPQEESVPKLIKFMQDQHWIKPVETRP